MMSASPRVGIDKVHANRLEALRMEFKENADNDSNNSNKNKNDIDLNEDNDSLTQDVEESLSETGAAAGDGGDNDSDNDDKLENDNQKTNNKIGNSNNINSIDYHNKHTQQVGYKAEHNTYKSEDTNDHSYDKHKHQHNGEAIAEEAGLIKQDADGASRRRSRRLDTDALALSVHKPVRITEKYEIGAKIGRGHFAVVRRATSKLDGKEYAVKMISADFLRKDASLRDEIECLKRVGDFPYVVRMIELFEDHHGLYLVMDLCTGGDLFSRISKTGKYSEKKAAKCCRQLAQAIQHIHRCGITHRDLKPENVLLVNDSPDSDIKVADFGLSKLLNDPATKMQTVCGTWAYCAPEVMEDKPYDMTVDNWTLGVLAFILLSGYHPFDTYGDLPEPDVIKNVRSAKYDFNDAVWNCISEEPKRLIRSLLAINPAERMSMEEFLSSPWVAVPVMYNSDSPAPSPLANVPRRLGEIMDSRNKIKSIVMAKIVSKKLRRFLDQRKSVDENNSPRSSFGSGSNSPFLSPRSPLTPTSPKPVTPPFFNRSINGASPTANRRELDAIRTRRKGSVVEELTSPFVTGAPRNRRGSLGLPAIVPPASNSAPVSPTATTPTAASVAANSTTPNRSRRTSIVGIITTPDLTRPASSSGNTTPTHGNTLSISSANLNTSSLSPAAANNINPRRTSLNFTNNNLSAQFGAIPKTFISPSTPTSNSLNPSSSISPTHHRSGSHNPSSHATTASKFTGFSFGNMSAATTTSSSSSNHSPNNTSSNYSTTNSSETTSHLIMGNNSAAAAAAAAARKARRNTSMNISALQISPAPAPAPAAISQTPGTTHRRVISLDASGISPRMAAFFGQNSPAAGLSPRNIRQTSATNANTVGDPTSSHTLSIGRAHTPSPVTTNNLMVSASPQASPRGLATNKRSLAVSAALKLATE